MSTLRTLRPPGDRAGFSLLELTIVLGLSLIVWSLAFAVTAPMRDRARGIGAARHLAARLAQMRIEALRRGDAAGLRFRTTAGEVTFEPVADGNGNGLRSAELDRGIDLTTGTPERLADDFPGVRFAIVTTVPPVDGEGPPLAAGSSAVRIGSSTIASFGPSGGSTSGTWYLAGPDDRQFAVRLFGPTGRLRVYEFQPGTRAWTAR